LAVAEQTPDRLPPEWIDALEAGYRASKGLAMPLLVPHLERALAPLVAALTEEVEQLREAVHETSGEALEAETDLEDARALLVEAARHLRTLPAQSELADVRLAERLEAAAAAAEPVRQEWQVVDRHGMRLWGTGDHPPPQSEIEQEDLDYPDRAPHRVQHRTVFEPGPWVDVPTEEGPDGR
jgi:hypothetical protein